MTHRRNFVGRPVQGADFYGREAEQRRIWQWLETDNLLLLAPRRVGKTSLRFRLNETAEQHGFQATYLSVSDIHTELGFVRSLFEGVQKLQSAGSIFERIRSSELSRFFQRLQVKKATALGASIEFTAEASDQWESLGRALTITLDAQPTPTLLLIDELPLFVLELLKADPTGARARRFLNWLRQLRQGPQGGLNIRWLLAGSIGLDNVAARHNLGDTINDFRLIQLGAFPEAVADRFLTELSATYRIALSEAVRAHMLARIGWPIPFFLQLLFSQIRERDEAAPDIAAVDASFEALLAPTGRGYFDYWRQRLFEQLSPEETTQALALLQAIAPPPGGAAVPMLDLALHTLIPDPTARAQQLRYLLHVLENDGYTISDGGYHRFRSPLLRAHWLKTNVDH